MHIYASAFSRRDRSRRAWRRRRVAMLPALFGALTGLVLLGIAEVAPVIVGAIL